MSYFVYQSLLFTGLVFYTWQRTSRQGVPFRIAWNLALILMVFGFVGARAFHVVYEYPDLYAEDWSRIFRFWEGGFVFFGGFIVAFVVAVAYLVREGESILKWADFYAPILALGYSLGRIGCLIAGCCYGAYCDAPWAVGGRHPTQLYAATTELVLYLFLLRTERDRPAQGLVFSIWLMGHGLGRLLMESYRVDFRGAAPAGLSISSWISLLLFCGGVALYARLLLAKNSR